MSDFSVQYASSVFIQESGDESYALYEQVIFLLNRWEIHSKTLFIPVFNADYLNSPSY